MPETLQHSHAPKHTEFEGKDEKEQQEREEGGEGEARIASIQKAHEWLEETIRQSDRWTNHLSQIRLECPYTLAELHQLGRLPRDEGVRKCQALIRVPVIYDEIGLFVWTTLAAVEACGPDTGRGGGSSDRTTPDNRSLAAEGITGRSELFLASLDERFRFDRPGGWGSSSSWGSASKERRRTRRYSPPVSPKGTLAPSFSCSPPNFREKMSDNNNNKQQDSYFGQQDSIEEVPEETDDEEQAANMRCGRIQNHDKAHTAGCREGEAYVFNASRRSTSSNYNGSPTGRSQAVSFISRAPGRNRSKSLGEKVNSILGSLSKTVVATLGEGLPRRQGRRSLLLDRRRVKSF